MLAHTYLHKPTRKNKLTMCNHQADSPLCVTSCLIWWLASLDKAWSYMTLNVLTETRCHYTTQTHICNHQSTLCVTWCLIWWFASSEKLFSHDTKCPNWDQVSLNNTNQIKPNQTCTYPHKAPRKIKVTRFNHQADSPLYAYVWDVYSAALQVQKSIVVRDTEWPYWDQQSETIRCFGFKKKTKKT